MATQIHPAEDYGPAPMRLRREMNDCGPSLTERLGEWLSEMSFSSPLHRLRLRGKFPLKLLAVPYDPVPGDAEAGQRFREGDLARYGTSAPIRSAPLTGDLPDDWRSWVHSWAWLRDLRAVGPIERSEAKLSKLLAKRWLAAFKDYDSVAWAPDVTGTRVVMAACYAPFLMPGVDHIHRSLVLNAIARWTRHLRRATPKLRAGMPRMKAATGLLAGALVLPGNRDRQREAEDILAKTLALLLPGGNHIVTRSPLDAARTGDLLLTLVQFYRARKLTPAPAIEDGLRNIRAMLAALTPGNGLPASWHGGAPDRDQIERLGVTTSNAPPMEAGGYQRLEAGRTCIIVDTGPLPPLRLTDRGHASTLSFQMSDGPDPIVVNCGGEYGPDGTLRFSPDMVAGLRSTAAHSTLVIDSTNSSRLPDGGSVLRGRAQEVLHDVLASSNGQWLEAQHDGYCHRFGFYHMRRLFLSADGSDLRGEDLLLPEDGPIAWFRRRETLPFAIRFHLAPGVTPKLGSDGKSATLVLGDLPADPATDAPAEESTDSAGKTAHVRAWTFRASFNHAPGRLSVEPSIHVAPDGTPVPVQQLLLTAEATTGAEASVGWSFKRAST